MQGQTVLGQLSQDKLSRDNLCGQTEPGQSVQTQTESGQSVQAQTEPGQTVQGHTKSGQTVRTN